MVKGNLESFLPVNLPQEDLSFLMTQVKKYKHDGLGELNELIGVVVTLSCNGSQELKLDAETLEQRIRAYGLLLFLEDAQRQGFIEDLNPIKLINVFADDDKISLRLTDKGIKYGFDFRNSMN